MAPQTRSLTFINGLAIVIGVQIGSGIFTSPSTVLESISSPFAAVTVWFFAGLLAWTGAASFIELGILVPRNGGIQEYIRFCYGDACACVATWMLIVVIKPCSIAMVALVFSEYLFKATGSDTVYHDWYAKILALVTIAIMTFLNCIGTRISARIANLFLVVKILGLGSVVLFGLTSALVRDTDTHRSSLVRRSQNASSDTIQHSNGPHRDAGQWTTAGMYTDAILAAMYSYSGWETLGYVGGEIIDAKRVISRVLNSAMTIVIFLYVLANMAYLNVVPLDILKQTDTIALDFGRDLFGYIGGVYFCWVVSLSCLGSLDVKIFTLGRLAQAAVQRGYLPQALDGQSRTKGNRGTPHKLAVVSEDEQPVSFKIYFASFAIPTFYVIIGSFRLLLTFIGMASNALSCVTVFGLLALRFIHPNTSPSERQYTHGKVLSPVTFCTASGFVVLRSAFRHPLQGWALSCFLAGAILVTRTKRFAQ